MEDLYEVEILNSTLDPEYENPFKHFEYPGNVGIWNEPDSVGYVKLVLSSVVIIGGLFGNISVILTVALNRSMRTTINIYIANLAVADAMTCVFCMVPHALSVLTGGLFILGEFMCKFNSFMQITCLICSVLTLSAISCDRFMAIMFPLRSRITKKRTSVVNTFIWIMSIVISIPVLIVKKYEFIEWKNFMEPLCHEKWPFAYFYDLSTGEWASKELRYIYYPVISIMLFFLPVGIMITAYLLIVLKLWKSKIPGEQHEANVNAHSKARKKVIKMVLTVLVAFIVCWTSLQLLLWEVLPETNSEFVWFSYFIAYANSFINPIIYGGFSKTFRDGFCILLKCGCKSDSSGRLARWRSTLSTRLTVLSPRSSTKTMADANRVVRQEVNP